MSFSKQNRGNTLSGILFVALFATSASYISEFAPFRHLSISPLIIGIVLGMIYANTLKNNLPSQWRPGIIFSTKTLLRTAIVFYGFRLTFQNIIDVGFSGFMVSSLVVILTFLLGYFVGVKVLKMDKDLVILTSSGSAICGAAAVLATESAIKAEPYKSAIAVSTVVLFGTISMFLYPFLYKAGMIPLDESAMGIYVGGTLHEVANVVAAGNAISQVTSENAIIVKMIRVMMIAPFLLILSFWLAKTTINKVGNQAKQKIVIPWFAVLFIVVIGFNSLNLLPANIITDINALDTFALTMAMSALGMETSLDKFKNVGMKPIYLALVLFVWLIFGGYFIVKMFL